jgi:hypothetical protein
MKAFLKNLGNAIGVGLAKVAVYAVEHPDKVLAVVTAAKAARK